MNTSGTAAGVGKPHRRGHGHQLSLVDRGPLGVRAAAHDAHDRVAHRPTGRPGTHLEHPARELQPGDLVLHRRAGVEAHPLEQVGAVHRRGRDVHHHLLRSGHGSGTSVGRGPRGPRGRAGRWRAWPDTVAVGKDGPVSDPSRPIEAGDGGHPPGSLDFALPPGLAELADEATTVARAAAARREVTEDSWLIGTSREFSLELGARGWLGMTWPGSGAATAGAPLERFVVVEALISEGAPLATSWFADRQIGPTLLQFGTDEQRRRWLPDIVAGTSAWCIGMSEPDAGSDVAAHPDPRRAAPGTDDAGWSTAPRCGPPGPPRPTGATSIARTDPDAPPHAGLSELVVDMRAPGIEVRPIRDATGNEHFCEVLLRRGGGARRPPGRRPQRQLPAGDAPDGARARRHRPPGVEPAAVPGRPRRRGHHLPGGPPADRPTGVGLPGGPQPGAARGARARPRRGGRRSPRPCAPSSSSDVAVLRAPRWPGPGPCCGTGSPGVSATPPPTP